MSIMDSIDIGANALKVHGKRIDIHAKNIANLDTPNYVRKIPVLNATDDISFHGLMNTMKEDVFGVGTLPYLEGGVSFSGVVEDPTLGEKIYKPGHPDADANGYIRASNVNAMVDIADALMAQRAYEANLALVNITKSMAQRALEIGK
ncbi:MAG: flagellar basal body rod C-terminal domain-containing protein [Candidatus Gastranaerophilaceae bacterium]|jgi:flagellar basal-body rod protein FlgC|nr:flagellar basal body rod protein FlgC [bacterium]MEE0495411.1 flagellar basal body rod C-terminal domain-containing protein [Cyanobacteriota bacterium]CDE92812.1 flagellar basal-body rod protein FlgC [Fusobacterium sp. CAG:815]DAA90010.1 MAG TPA: flagellar basal body rod protein FlgC [Candidatus Gastranaerophilales bacterium HUM_6]DAA93771.1 MAG TPA: flagellar basal body rod protein FlgC [Candidatus Gastranaerophilales bacterium HUM_7]DAB02389.1 MAG TPA: flagellar basal body rod protein Flg